MIVFLLAVIAGTLLFGAHTILTAFGIAGGIAGSIAALVALIAVGGLLCACIVSARDRLQEMQSVTTGARKAVLIALEPVPFIAAIFAGLWLLATIASTLGV